MSSDDIIDDTSPQILYSPESAWQLDTTLGAYGPYNGTVHTTAQVNATASITFTGTSISAACFLSQTGSNFTATLDDTLVGTYNTAVSSISAVTTKTMFTKSGLDGNSQHTLVLQKIANDPGWVSSLPGDQESHLDIDSFTIVGGNPSMPEQTTSPTGSSPPSHSVSPGAIAGIVVGVVALLLLLAAFFWHRRQIAQKTQVATHTPFVNRTPPEIEPKRASLNTSSPASTAAASSVPQRQALNPPREKVGLLFSNQNEGSGGNSRRRWRSSLFELPGNRVVRAQSRMPPPRTLPSEGGGNNLTSAATSDAGASLPLLAVNTNANTQFAGSRVQGNDGDNITIPDTILSPLSGPESHITESAIPPSTVPPSLPPPVPIVPEAGSSSPSASPNAQNLPQKASFQGPHSGTTSSLPISTSPPPSASVSPSSASRVNTAVLLRELAGLRDQVRHLTDLHRGGGGGGLYAAGETELHDPPPEYVGRGSGESSRVTSEPTNEQD